MMKKTIVISLVMTVLTGCLATTNLLTDGTLNSQDQNIANIMAEKTVSHCVTFRENGSGQKTSGDQRVSKLPEVKAFYTASDNWYKADVLSSTSVWFSVYFNSRTNKFTCGKGWEDYSESRTVQFIRRGIQEKSINDTASWPAPKSQNSNLTENKLSQVKSLFHKDLITSQQYDEQVKRILEGQ